MHRLIFLAAVLLAAPLQAADYLGSFHWTYPKPYFGGWSGIDISEDGEDFVAIGDSGQITRGVIEREGDAITGLAFPYVGRLKTLRGEETGPTYAFDAEGLAVAPDGEIYVAFERWVRVWRYADWTATPDRVARHEDFSHMRLNGALEALAIAPDGALYALPESQLSRLKGRNVYRLTDGAWEVFDVLSPTGSFVPVGADIGPDGFFYLLERNWIPLLGFRTRVRRFALAENGLRREEILLQTRFRVHDNLEGISVWRDENDRLRLTMVSDDNFSRFQRTEIVEYAVPDRVEP